MDFYGAAAQIIPVLFLALVFENRMLTRPPGSYSSRENDPGSWNVTQVVARSYFTVLIAVGEVAALIGLYERQVHPLINGLVWVGLCSALIALVWSVLGHQWGYWREWWATSARDDWWLSALVLAGLLTITGSLLAQFS